MGPIVNGVGSHGQFPLPLSRDGTGHLRCTKYVGWEGTGRGDALRQWAPHGNPEKPRWDGTGLLCQDGWRDAAGYCGIPTWEYSLGPRSDNNLYPRIYIKITKWDMGTYAGVRT